MISSLNYNDMLKNRNMKNKSPNIFILNNNNYNIRVNRAKIFTNKGQIIEGELNFSSPISNSTNQQSSIVSPTRINNFSRVSSNKSKKPRGLPRKSPVPVPKNFKQKEAVFLQNSKFNKPYAKTFKEQLISQKLGKMNLNLGSGVLGNFYARNGKPKTRGRVNSNSQNLHQDRSYTPLFRSTNSISNNSSKANISSKKNRIVSKSPVVINKNSILSRFKNFGFLGLGGNGYKNMSKNMARSKNKNNNASDSNNNKNNNVYINKSKNFSGNLSGSCNIRGGNMKKKVIISGELIKEDERKINNSNIRPKSNQTANVTKTSSTEQISKNHSYNNSNISKENKSRQKNNAAENQVKSKKENDVSDMKSKESESKDLNYNEEIKKQKGNSDIDDVNQRIKINNRNTNVNNNSNNNVGSNENINIHNISNNFVDQILSQNYNINNNSKNSVNPSDNTTDKNNKQTTVSKHQNNTTNSNVKSKSLLDNKITAESLVSADKSINSNQTDTKDEPLINRNESIENIEENSGEKAGKKCIKKIKDIYTFTHVGFDGENNKENNQDSYFVFKNFAGHKDYLYMSVCDGHGAEGHFVSRFIRQILPEDLSENLKGKDILNETELTHKIITETFLIANEKLIEQEEINSLFSGTTCVSVIYTPERLLCANIGDSRAVLAREEDGVLKSLPLSRDHKPSEKDEATRILENDGRIQPFFEDGEFIGPPRVWLKEDEVPGLAMTRSFGDRVAATVGTISEPEIKEFPVQEGDKFMLIASDGVWEFMENEEVMGMIKQFYDQNNLEECCEYIYQESKKRWLKEEEVIDDITMILVVFE